MEDCSVGSIVWVRRRNGSWWPGRILGPEELSASHIMSPRSGTPVKLLGREDASVDYYNLEKSKRVKAFRCGEFDACIERAEASQGIPIKKREKYARREDAILHALELEQKQLGMKQKKPSNISVGMSSKTTGAPKKELSDLSPEVYMRNDDPGLYRKFVSHKYQIVAHEEDNISKSLYTRKELSWEKDNPEAISRMEGLQDFGLQIAPSKRELFPSATWETSGKPVENHVDVLSCVGLMRKDAVRTVGCRNSLSSKRKRPEGSLVEETLFRKHDRHRPLVHAKSPISPSFQFDYDAGVISREDETNHMGSICQAKRSRYIYLPANSNDSLDHSGYHSGEMTINDDLHHLASLAEEYTSSGLIEATESNSSERIFWEDEMEEEAKLLTDDILAPVPGSKDCDPPGFHIQDKFGYANNAEIPLSSCISQSSAEVGVYSWCSKGKRNARSSIARRPFDETGGKIYATVSDKHYGSAKGTTKMGRTEPSSLYHKKGFNHAFNGGDTNSGGTHLTGYGTHISFYDSDSDPSDGPHSARRVYWGESDSFFEPMLVDVDLKVQTKYQGEHVPLVSLMSRLNGKAIIGHPVQIEILEDGGSLVDSRASTSTPIWRTARRSAAQRVARSRPAMSALEAWDTELVKKSRPHARRSIPGKSHKKLASNLKIKTLSYTASDRKRRGRLIDPEMVVPLVACVPVKVVFSRILEAVRVRMSGPGLRGPS